MECFEKKMILLIHTSYLRDVASISVEKNVVSKRTKDIHVVFKMIHSFLGYLFRPRNDLNFIVSMKFIII